VPNPRASRQVSLEFFRFNERVEKVHQQTQRNRGYHVMLHGAPPKTVHML